MRVLMLCHKPPFPPVDGGAVSERRVALDLAAAGHDVTVLAMTTPKHRRVDHADAAAHGVPLATVFVDTRLHTWRALRGLVGPMPVKVRRFCSGRVRRALAAHLEAVRPDVVHLEGFAAAAFIPAIRAATRAPVVLRAENVEHELWRQRAEAERRPLLRWLLAREAARVRAFELASWRSADAVAAISREVADACRPHARGPVAEVGVSVDPGPPPPPASAHDVFHLGAMDWGANRSGVRWLLGSVWPEVLRAQPHAVLRLAGRGSDRVPGLGGHPGVVVDGEVADAAAYLDAHGVLVVPVLEGSGLRVKVVEGMARGRPIVSTPLGACGIGAVDGRDLLLAEGAGRFAAQVVRCLTEPGLARELGDAARRFALESFAPGALVDRLTRLYTAAGARR